MRVGAMNSRTRLEDTHETESSRLAAEAAKDQLWFVLSNYRRRYAIEYLLDNRREIPLRELAEGLAAWENDVAEDATTGSQRKRAYVALRQTHLPKLDELGIVEYDTARGVVQPGERLDEIRALLADEGPSTLTPDRRLLALVGVETLVVLVLLGRVLGVV